MFTKDARDYQILFLGLFLFLGVSTRDWSLQGDLLLVIVASCLLTQGLFCFLNKHPLSSFKSALITALSLCLLLRANDYTTMALAASLAISSKFLFYYQDKHFFNPANFGIIMALLLTNDAWVSPGQWGSDGWYLLLFFGLGGLILGKVGRWETSVTFLVSYGLLEAVRHLYLGWSWDVWQHQFMSGSLLLFAFFMISDPRSTPNAPISRVIWSISLAILTFILRDYFQLTTAMFWALFILSPVTVYLDANWKGSRFNWGVT